MNPSYEQRLNKLVKIYANLERVIRELILDGSFLSYYDMAVFEAELVRQTGIAASLVNQWAETNVVELYAIGYGTGTYAQAVQDGARGYVDDLNSRTSVAMSAIVGGIMNRMRTARQTITRADQISSSDTFRSRQYLNDKVISTFFEGGKLRTINNLPIKSYAKSVGNDVLAQARVAGTADEAIKAGVDLVRVVGSPTKHEVCKQYLGDTLSLTGATDGYKTLEDAYSDGMFHINCRHHIEKK